MIIKTNSSPLLITAAFLILRGYLPMAASEIISNGTHPNTMEGRGLWSTIPMPVISHFAGDKSRQNYAVWWQRATIALKQWLSIVDTATDITVSRRLVSSKSFVVTRMVALDRKCSREFFMLINTTSRIRRIRSCCWMKTCLRRFDEELSFYDRMQRS